MQNRHGSGASAWPCRAEADFGQLDDLVAICNCRLECAGSRRGGQETARAAVGAPLPRRGPAPRRRSRYVSLAAPSSGRPGRKLAALADFLRGHTDGGALMRRLHPAAEPNP